MVSYGAEGPHVNMPRNNSPDEIPDFINSKGAINLNNRYGTDCYISEVRERSHSCY